MERPQNKHLRPKKKGDPNHQGGRPKGSYSVKTIAAKVGDIVTPKAIIEAMENLGVKVTDKSIAAVLMYSLALKGLLGDSFVTTNSKGETRQMVDVKAIKEFFDRRDGKATESIILSGSEENPVKIETKLTKEETDAISKTLLAAYKRSTDK